MGPRPDSWFESFYREAAEGRTTVSWADGVPNPNLVPRWERIREVVSGRAPRVLVVGAGYGDDAAWLASQGAQVWAFDLAPTAVQHARQRFPDSSVHWFAGDLFALPVCADFDCVLETYTLQVIPPSRRSVVFAALAHCVAPGGELWLIARGRDADESEGEMPWPLVRSEFEAWIELGLQERSFEDYLDDEDPPLRRFVARYRRPR